MSELKEVISLIIPRPEGTHLAGKNFKSRLNHTECHGIKIFHNAEKKFFILEYLGQKQFIDQQGCMWSYVCEEAQKQQDALPKFNTTQDKNKRSSAQVSTPMGHVFEGLGAGKK